MNEKYSGKFKLTLDFISDGLFGDFVITFDELNLTNYAIKKIIFTKSSGTYTATITYNDGITLTLTGATNIINAFVEEIIGVGMITFSSTAVPTDDLRGTLIANEDLILYDTVTMFTYLLDDPKIKVTKTLVWVSSLEIRINRVIGNKELYVDIAHVDEISSRKFNYVYIPQLNRYYYVNDVSLINGLTTCRLVEDVLMSFSDLIYSQTGFVRRQESYYNLDKVDEYVTYDYDKVLYYTTVTDLLNLFVAKPIMPIGSYRYTMTVVGKYA